MRGLLIFMLSLASILCKADNSVVLVRSIPVTARLMTVDENGNVYLVRENNALVKFSPEGDSLTFFRSIRNGDIGSVDATNPLRIVVYYPGYNKVVLLDRMLSQQNELDLRKLNIYATALVASSADGNLWIYDQFYARLRKIDEQLNEIVQSNDVRQETQTVPTPSFMIERDWKLFLCDTSRGIFTFDRYGSYINTVSLYGVRQLQVFGSQLVYRHADSLLSWDMNRITSSVLLIPDQGKIINAAIARDKLYVLYADRLVFYKLKEGTR